MPIKFIYSVKATKFCEIFTLLLSYVVPVKSKLKISQNVVAFSEYMYELYKNFVTPKGLPGSYICRLGTSSQDKRSASSGVEKEGQSWQGHILQYSAESED